MNNYRITVKQISDNEIQLEDIRDIFAELGITSVSDFNQMKKMGVLKIPSYDNLNAFCKKRNGEKFEVFFFGKTEVTKKVEKKIFDDEIIDAVRKWCVENDVKTLYEYRSTKHPRNFPTYKATVDLYGEEYFYEILGLEKSRVNFSSNFFDESFIPILSEWCTKNKVLSKNDYLNKKPHDFPSLERIRQLTGKSNYFKDVIEFNFKNSK